MFNILETQLHDPETQDFCDKKKQRLVIGNSGTKKSTSKHAVILCNNVIVHKYTLVYHKLCLSYGKCFETKIFI